MPRGGQTARALLVHREVGMDWLQPESHQSIQLLPFRWLAFLLFRFVGTLHIYRRTLRKLAENIRNHYYFLSINPPHSRGAIWFDTGKFQSLMCNMKVLYYLC